MILNISHIIVGIFIINYRYARLNMTYFIIHTYIYIYIDLIMRVGINN